MEAQYAHRLEKRGQLKIVYVMLDANYTTLSTPESVSGWLGLMIGESMWQRAFGDDNCDPEQAILQTTQHILAVFTAALQESETTMLNVAVQDHIMVTKAGSKTGKIGTVIDADWNGMVKVDKVILVEAIILV